MKSVPLLLMVVVVMLLRPTLEAALSPTPPHYCPASTTILDDDSVVNVPATSNGTQTGIDITVYGRPRQGFKGVRLVAQAGDDGGVDSWFPLDNTCFPGSFDWWKVAVSAWVITSFNMGSVHRQVNFGLRTGHCTRLCYKTVNFTSVVRLTVFGHGNSEWRLHLPDKSCITSMVSDHNYPVKATVCTKTPHTVTGDFFKPDLPRQCRAEGHISGPDSTTNIGSTHGEPVTRLGVWVYVHPGLDFKGVSVVVMSGGAGGESHTAWFPYDLKCFQGHADWWAMYVKAWMEDQTSHNSTNFYRTLIFQVLTGDCHDQCPKNVTLTRVKRLTVTAHGTSAWRINQPDDTCTTVGVSRMDRVSKFPSCRTPPRSETTPTPAHTSHTQLLQPVAAKPTIRTNTTPLTPTKPTARATNPRRMPPTCAVSTYTSLSTWEVVLVVEAVVMGVMTVVFVVVVVVVLRSREW